ncbi:MAG: hypothetical protein ABI789_15685, partial [Usitatibacter sp.]
MSFHRFASVALVLFAVARSAPAQQTTPTIGQLDGAPFASGLVAAPAGGTVAWVLNARGVRNVWAADAAGGRARAVTAFTGDDGQDITDLTFTRDGRTLYFVRGGGPNRAGEVPNPTSDAGGAEQAVWRVGLDGSAARRVVEGSQPTPSRTGLAFVRRGQVFWLADSVTTREPVPMFRSRGAQGSLRWSPDESRLAFTSNRGTHAFVGVYEPAARRITWLAPSTDTDGEAAWSPDGTRVAFIRAPYERHR